MIEKYITFCMSFLNFVANAFEKYPNLKILYLVFLILIGYLCFKQCCRLLGIHISMSSIFSDLWEPLKCILPGVLISIVIAFMISF